MALENYDLTKITDTNYKISQGNDTIGFISADTVNHMIKTAIDITTPERSYSRSLFGYIFKFVTISVSESYASNHFPHPAKSELISCKRYVKQFLSHKKLKKEPVQVESFHEFYVLEKKYISKAQFKPISTSTFLDLEKQTILHPFGKIQSQKAFQNFQNS